MDNLMLNNKIYLEGKIVSKLEFSHEMYGEGFYTFFMEVTRLSDSVDLLNITVSETAKGINDIAEKTSELSTVVDDNESLVNTNKENTDKLDSVLSMFKH